MIKKCFDCFKSRIQGIFKIAFFISSSFILFAGAVSLWGAFLGFFESFKKSILSFEFDYLSILYMNTFLKNLFIFLSKFIIFGVLNGIALSLIILIVGAFIFLIQSLIHGNNN